MMSQLTESELSEDLEDCLNLCVYTKNVSKDNEKALNIKAMSV